MSPAWSVVVPTYARPDGLRRCLAALDALEAPGGLEVIVVDDGSPEPVPQPAAGRVRVLRQQNAGPAAARNAGLSAATGRWVAFTDDDCRPEPGWLVALQAALEQQPDALVGGRTVNALPGVWPDASQLVVDHVVDATPGGFLPSCNLAARRDALGDGFDEAYPGAAGEDRAFCDAWRARGRPVVLVPEAIVRHEHALDVRRFWRQHAGYGAAARRVHTTPGGSRPGPPSSYLALVGRAGGVDAPVRRRLALGAALALSQVATAWGYGRAVLASRR